MRPIDPFFAHFLTDADLSGWDEFELGQRENTCDIMKQIV